MPNQMNQMNKMHSEPTADQIKTKSNLLEERQHYDRIGTATQGPRKNINMDAYHAYYNTDETGNTSGVNASEKQFSKTQKLKPNSENAQQTPLIGTTTTAPSAQGENGNILSPKNGQKGGPGTTNIINNIMHINHSGANINITSMPNC